MGTPTDGLIVHEILAGNTALYRVLVDRHGRRVCRVVKGLVVNTHDAEDITQDVFTKAYEKLSQLQNHERFGQWLISIARNCCVSWLRRASNRAAALGEQDTSVSPPDEVPDQTPSRDVLLDAELRETLEALLDKLPPKCRSVGKLYYLHGLTCQEICDALGVRMPTVESRLHRARKKIKDTIVANGQDIATRRIANSVIQAAKEMFAMDSIRLEISKEMVPLVAEPTGDGRLIALVKQVREGVRDTEGVVMPRVHIIDDLELPRLAFRVSIQEQPVAEGRLTGTQDLTPVRELLRQCVLDHSEKLDQD